MMGPVATDYTEYNRTKGDIMITRKTFSIRGAFLLAIVIIGLAIYGQGRRTAAREILALAGEQPDAVVVAQEQAKSQSERELKERQIKAAAGAGMESIGSVVEHPFAGGAVKGAPFSAQVIFESTQTTASGLHISHKLTGALYRDGEGRTRQEMPRDGTAEIVLINDPVAGTASKLHMFQHTVLKVSYGGAAQTNREREEKEIAEKMAQGAAARQSSPGTGVQRKSESLGTQSIEGVQAQGTRYTVTVPPGTEGNDQAFDIVSEKWYSSELKMVVMMKRSDPRTGDSVYRLTGINRGEPDHAVFEAPSDFTVREERQTSEGKTEAKRR
jgi:hypothetical protein